MLQTFFPYRLALTAEAFSRQLTDVYKTDFGLSREEWRLLFLLAQSDSVTSRDLAERTSLDKVQVSRAADRLERKGLILRQTLDTDRRLRLYACTEAGRALFDQTYQRVSARAEAILSDMSESDRAALERGLTALQAAIGGTPAST
jgi:DNA-binding MarR family transcriptional regulator